MEFIEIMRCIAAVSVLNSHYDDVYPVPLDGGGEFGLAIFFLLSGYLSVNINNETRFHKWIIKRVMRMYIPIFIWQLLLIFVTSEELISGKEILSRFIYPTNYWFVSYMVIVYIAYYLIYKFIYMKYDTKGVKYLLITLLIIFTVLYFMRVDFSRYCMQTYSVYAKILWLFCSVLGLYLRKNINIKCEKRNKKIYQIVLFFCMYGLMKIVMKFAQIHTDLFYIQCFVTIFAILCTVCMFLYLRKADEQLRKIKNIRWIDGIIEMISKSSMELYIVQFFFIDVFADFFFPLNWLLITVTAIMTGYLLHRISNKIMGRVMKRGQG